MVYVTHDQVEAMTLADRLVVLHQGRIAQQGPPLDLYQRPRDLFVAGFIGSPRMNLLPGTLEPADQAGHAVVLPGGQRIPVQAGPTRQGRVKVTLGIRPEHLQLAGSRHDGLEAETVAAERLGDQTLVHLRWNADQEPVLLRIPGDKAPAMGERLRLKLPKAACHLFDAAGKRLPETEPQ
jgi:ABC-type sugar transport system ATPase subunit